MERSFKFKITGFSSWFAFLKNPLINEEQM